MQPNTIRSIWQRGECVLNGWLQIPSPFAAEMMAHAGWDSVTIDMQHGPVEYAAALGMVQAINTTATIPLARVPWNEPGIIMKMLDAGCYGIICPMVNSRAECEAFVGACRYPPRGFRSYGPVRVAVYAGAEYAAQANDAIITIAMIETRQAVENLHDILQTPGLDAIYIGPADLSQSYGYPPRVDPEQPELVQVIDDIVAAARAHGVIPGMHTGSVAYAQRLAAKGVQFVTVGSDARLLTQAATQATAAFRANKQERAEPGVY